MSALALAACKSDGSQAPAGPSRLVQVRNVADAPRWSVPYGGEFWRKRAEAGAAVATAGVVASPELDLSETIERVNHAFTEHHGGVRSESATFAVEADGAALRFLPGSAREHATVALRSIRRGDAAWSAADGGDAFVLGNTLQRRLAVGEGTVIEHVESRDDGVELTWVLPERPAGDGPLHVALAVDGLTYLARSESGHHFGDSAGVARMRISDAVLRDAAGGEWMLAIAKDAEGLHLAVPAEILAAATYPLAIDPVVSAEFGMDTPVTGGVATDLNELEVACGAGTCLVVWQDQRTGAVQVRGTRFDPATGAAADPYGLVLATGASQPDVAFDGSNFVVVYSSAGTIRAQQVTTAGTLSGAPIALGSGDFPRIAQGASSALVAYRRNTGAATKSDIFAATLSGTTVTATDVVVSSQPSSEGLPEVAWDGQGFVVTWVASGTDNDVWIARLSSAGAVTSSAAMLAGGAGFQYGVNVCGGGSGGGSLVVWYDSNAAVAKAQRFDATFTTLGSVLSLGYMGTSFGCASDGTHYLVVSESRHNRIVKASGALVTAAPGVGNGGTWTQPDVDFDGTRFIAVYGRYNAGWYNANATRIASDGSLLDASGVSLQAPAAGQTAPAVAFDGSNHAVIWQQVTTTGVQLRGVILDATGVSLTPSGFVLGDSFASYAPAVAYGGGRYLAVWMDTSYRIQAARVLPDGTVEDAPPLTLASTAYTPQVAFDGTRFVVSWQEYVSPSYDVHARTVSTTGTLGAAFPVAATAARENNPRIACRSTGLCLVTWSTSTSTSEYDVMMARIDGGVLLDASPLAVAATTEYESDPRVASDGTNFLVTYNSQYARRVAPDGTLLDAAPLYLGLFDVASFDGTNYVLARGNAQSIRIGQVTTAGVALTTAQIASSTYPMYNVDVTRAAGTRRSLVVYWVYDDGATIQNRRVKGRFVSFTSAPVAGNMSVSTSEDVARAVTLSASDSDGDPLTYTITSAPSHGTLTGTPPSLTYTPAPNYSGSDSFTFTANDGSQDSNVATVSITIHPVNDPPIANDQSVTTTEDTAITFAADATDVDSTIAVYTIVTGPAHGNVTVTAAGQITYTPNANFTGTDSFTWRARDASAFSNTATVTVTVTPVNDAPIASNQSVAVDEDSSVPVTLVGSDIDGDSLSFAVVDAPAHGTLTGTAPNLTYTPAANYNGSDSFTFRVNDGTVDSATATVSILIRPINDAPVAFAQSVTTDEDAAVAVALTATDIDGDALMYSIVSAPSHGTLSGTPPNLTYTPAANYLGPDSFTFKVNDGTVDSNTATITVAITGVNDAPVADAQSVTTDEDAPFAITLTGSDVDGDTLTYTVVAAPGHGTLAGTAPNLTYTPAANYNGSDAFTFKVSDGAAESPPATVEITVTPVNDAPVASNASATTAEDAAVAIGLDASDVDGDALTYSIVTAPAHGTLTGAAPNLTYTPAADYRGTDSFTFKVHDGTADSNIATVTIAITGVNDAPIADAQAVTVNEDGTVAITLTGSDVDGDALGFAVVAQPAHGVLTGTPPNLTYTPAANYHGSDAFTFKVHDGSVDSAPATVSIVVTPVNDAPVAVAQSVTTAEDTALGIVLTASDIDGDALGFQIVAAPGHGTLSGSAPNLTYTPVANYSGADSFTFKVNDGSVDSPTATVTISVTPVNDAPVATAQAVTTAEDTAASITLTGSDVDGDSLGYTIVTAPAHGTLTGSAPALTYTPAADYHGADSFTFKVNDGTADSAPATVDVTVTPVNDAPVAAAQTVTVDQGQQATITLSATDVDGDALTYAIVDTPAEGTLTGTPPNVTYTAPTGYRGATSFTFTASDGTLTSAAATITVQVNNGAPTVTVAADMLAPTEGQQIQFTATAADPGGDPITLSWDFGDGTTSTDQNPVHTYVDEGEYIATVTASDGLATATASITIDVQNGAPIVVPSSEAVAGDEATELTFTADVSDPGLEDTYTVVWSWGDGTPETSGVPATHTFADNGTYHVTVTVVDNDGASVVGSREVTIGNVPPVPEAQDPLTTDAGSEVTAQLVAIDRAGAADPLTWTLIDGPGTLTADGAYSWTPGQKDAGGHVVTARVSDDDGGTSDLVFSVEVIARDDGCGCRTASGSRGNALVLLGAFALVLRRRRSRG